MNALRLTGSAPSLRGHAAPPHRTLPWHDLPHVAVETCVEDVEGVRLSARAGADRAELCDNLGAQGTTPSIGAIEAAVLAAAEEVAERRATAGPRWFEAPDAAPFGLRVMIRPRGGSFVFDTDENRAMIADVRRVAALARELSEFTRPQRSSGARPPLPPAVEIGFVIGVLTEEHVVDRGLLRLLIDMADGAPVTFSKAIDETRDLVEAYGDLGGLGVEYVLTSGGAATALDGAEVLGGLTSTQGPRVIAAGTVRPSNLQELVRRSGVREIHLRCSRADNVPGEPQRTDEAMVRQVVERARTLPVPDAAD